MPARRRFGAHRHRSGDGPRFPAHPPGLADRIAPVRVDGAYRRPGQSSGRSDGEAPGSRRHRVHGSYRDRQLAVQAVLADRRRRNVFALVWPPVGAALGVLPFWWAGGQFGEWWAVALWGEMLALPVLASAYVCRAAPIASAEPWRILATITFASFVSAGIWLELGRGWLWLLSPAAPSPYALFDAMTMPAALGAVLVFMLASAINYAAIATDDRQAATAQALQAEVAAREAELRALRAQVNPHFLFNCLHSISSLIGSDPPAARLMCIE